MPINFNKFRSPEAKKALENQANTPRQNEGGGDVGFGLFDFSKAPHTVKKWEPKKGKNLIMILPVEVANEQNPSVVSNAVRIGDYDFGVTLYMHFGKGTVAGLSHVCLKRNYGKKCPRCDEFFLTPENGGTYVKGVKGSGNSAHASSERNVFLVVPFLNSTTPDEENMGLWNAPANSKTGFPVIDRAKEMADGNAIIPFWWPTDEGRLVEFVLEKEGDNYAEYKGIKFVKRPTELAEKMAEKYSFPLDGCLIIKDAEQINADMFGGPDRSHKAPSRQEEEYEESPSYQAAKEPEVDADMEFPKLPPVPEAKAPEAPKEEAPKASSGGCAYGHKYGADWQSSPDCRLCKRDTKDVFTACSEVI